MEELEKKIKEKTAKLGVIGLGYVGLPLAVEKAMAGFKTKGFDIQQKKVDFVNSGINYIGDVVDESLKNVVATGMLSATTNYELVKDLDCICICVPTPLDSHQQPILSYIKDSVTMILPYMHQELLIILESTTYPGTTEELVKPILESTGFCCGKDFYLAFSPERVDPGNLRYKTKNTPKVVGGITEKCTKLAAMLYEHILEAPVYTVSSPTVAEMEKILENTYRNINIGMINEFAILCDRMGINLWEVIEAAKTKPYGFQPFYPGPGLGGHCIPLDPYYLTWKAREYGFHTSMIEAAMVINDNMPAYCAERIQRILNNDQKSVKDSHILILGIAYKQDINDCRESPAIKVIKHLLRNGAIVSYYDSYDCILTLENNRLIRERELTKELIEQADLVVITTAHSNVDYAFVQQHANVIFDTKNVTRTLSNHENIQLL